jgi:hypothetical protein
MAAVSGGCALLGIGSGNFVSGDTRLAILRRAQVWIPTNVRAMDLRAGPREPGAVAPHAIVDCDYVDKVMSGHSPKFTCRISPHDEVKVKYGGDNGEVYGEVAATRLLWALGFGADRMYPVTVICHGCPSDPQSPAATPAKTVRFDIAAIERKMPGEEIRSRDTEGWAWPELALVDEEAGGAPRAHRDALKLLVAMLQHTDSKPQQQRLVCLDGQPSRAGGCRRPFMMVNDLGLTFGSANRLNSQEAGSVNFERWANMPVWRDGEACIARREPSLTGTLSNPAISEDGRRFLSRLLAQLTDTQLHDLFEVARFAHRGVQEDRHTSVGSIEDWVAAFKAKRDAIANRRCDNSAPVPTKSLGAAEFQRASR